MKIPTKRKQLFVLLATAAWVSLQLGVAWSDAGQALRPATESVAFNESSYVPGAHVAVAVPQFFAFSMPVVFLGGILFWWFGKQGEKEEEKTEK